MSVPTAPKKARSPNFPAISLEEAIQRLEGIYAEQQRYPATRETFAKLMGYGSLHGASATMISALSKYGLLEGHGDNLRVSELGQDLILHRKGDPEYTEALQTAAFMPAFFREMRDQYPYGLPSEHSLRANLIKRGFSPKAIDPAVRAYRDTIEFVDAETGASTLETPEPSVDGVAMQTQLRDEAKRITLASSSPTDAQFRWPLYEDIVAEVTFSGGEPTPDDIDLLREYLNLVRKARGRAMRQESPPQNPRVDEFSEEPTDA